MKNIYTNLLFNEIILFICTQYDNDDDIIRENGKNLKLNFIFAACSYLSFFIYHLPLYIHSEIHSHKNIIMELKLFLSPSH